MKGGIEVIAEAICADLRVRLPRQNKKQREGVALLAAMLEVRSANVMDVAASLPRQAERLDMRYQSISRVLGNALIEVDEVMAPYGRVIPTSRPGDSAWRTAISSAPTGWIV